MNHTRRVVQVHQIRAVTVNAGDVIRPRTRWQMVTAVGPGEDGTVRIESTGVSIYRADGVRRTQRVPDVTQLQSFDLVDVQVSVDVPTVP